MCEISSIILRPNIRQNEWYTASGELIHTKKAILYPISDIRFLNFPR